MSAPEIELYRIVSIRETTEITPEGVFVPYMEVTYVTKSGIEGRIRIKKEEFTKEKVAELVEKEATEIEETLKLRK